MSSIAQHIETRLLAAIDDLDDSTQTRRAVVPRLLDYVACPSSAVRVRAASKLTSWGAWGESEIAAHLSEERDPQVLEIMLASLEQVKITDPFGTAEVLTHILSRRGLTARGYLLALRCLVRIRHELPDTLLNAVTDQALLEKIARITRSSS